MKIKGVKKDYLIVRTYKKKKKKRKLNLKNIQN